MLLLSTKLHNIPLISIRSGVRIGTVLSPIINPHNLHIDAFWCEIATSKTNKVVLDMDIRDFSLKGILIDDHLGLSDPDELVRLSAVIELDYTLEGKAVLASKHKIGKVTDYAIDNASLYIQKLYVQPPVWKANIGGTRLTFDRSSVIEVTDTHIVVSGPEEKATSALGIAKNTSLANYSASTSLMSEKE
jgi:sporulation protein YlmC with PRC-barrel domain